MKVWWERRLRRAEYTEGHKGVAPTMSFIVTNPLNPLLTPKQSSGQNVQWHKANGYFAGWKTDLDSQKSEPNQI